MTKWVSAMNAPLLPEEEGRIQGTWGALRALCALGEYEATPQDMLGYCTDLILACYEVRRAIDDAWYYADKRKFGAKPQARSKVTPKDPVLDLIAELGMDKVMELLELQTKGGS